MSVPESSPASPGLRGVGTALLVWAGTMVMWGAGLDLFGGWLYGHYASMLDWGSRKSFFFLSTGPALIAVLGCGNKGWKAAPMSVLAASVVALAMAVNMIAAAVILWAVDPALVTGQGGYFTVVLAGLFLSLPVAGGALILLQRWRAMGLRWRDLLRGEPSRLGRVLGGVLGFVGMLTALAATLIFENWLRAAYPGAKDYSAIGFGVLCMLSVSLFIANTGPHGLALGGAVGAGRAGGF